MRRSTQVVLGVTASVALSLSGCGAPGSGSLSGGSSVEVGSDMGGVPAGDGSGSDESAQYAAVCADDAGNRVEDDQCGDPCPDTDEDGVCNDQETRRSHARWYFLPMGRLAPRIGSRLSGGSFNTPAAPFATGVGSAGGKLSSSSFAGKASSTFRGGFGSRGGFSGG